MALPDTFDKLKELLTQDQFELLLDGDFEEDYLVHSPIPGYDNHYVLDPQRHFIRYVYHVKRDSLFTDLFAKLGRS